MNTNVRNPQATKAVETLEEVVMALHRGRQISWTAMQLIIDQTKNIKTEIAMIP